MQNINNKIVVLVGVRRKKDIVGYLLLKKYINVRGKKRRSKASFFRRTDLIKSSFGDAIFLVQKILNVDKEKVR